MSDFEKDLEFIEDHGRGSLADDEFLAEAIKRWPEALAEIKRIYDFFELDIREYGDIDIALKEIRKCANSYPIYRSYYLKANEGFFCAQKRIKELEAALIENRARANEYLLQLQAWDDYEDKMFWWPGDNCNDHKDMHPGEVAKARRLAKEELAEVLGGSK